MVMGMGTIEVEAVLALLADVGVLAVGAVGQARVAAACRGQVMGGLALPARGRTGASQTRLHTGDATAIEHRIIGITDLAIGAIKASLAVEPASLAGSVDQVVGIKAASTDGDAGADFTARAAGQASGAREEVGFDAGLAGRWGCAVHAGAGALRAGRAVQVVVRLAGQARVAAAHREGAGEAALGTGPAGVAGGHEVAGGAGGADGGAGADITAIGAAHTDPRHSIGIILAQQTIEALVTLQTVLRALETEPGGGGQHIATGTVEAQILIAALQAAEGAQDARCQAGVVVVGGIAAGLGPGWAQQAEEQDG